MRHTRFSATAALALLLAPIALADYDLIFPFVAMGKAGNSTDEWEDFHAQAIEVNDGLTTYSVGCATDPCAGWSGGNTYSYTMVLANNTFDFRYEDRPILSTHTACTFTGTPATAASCEMTKSATILTSTMNEERHFTIPYTGTENWDLYAVMSATMRILDGTAGATPTGSGGGSGSETTPAPTETGTAAGGEGASSTQSSGRAAITRVPGWAVGVGMGVAAVAVGV